MPTCKKVDMDFFTQAPKVFVHEIELSASPSAIFASFENADDWPLWVDSIARVDWTSPRPFGVGTTRRVTFTNGKTAAEEFIAWQQDRRMAFCFTETDQHGTRSFAEDYEVIDLGAGRSKLIWRVAFDPQGVSKIVFAVFGFLIARIFRKALADFKVFIEAKAMVSDA